MIEMLEWVYLQTGPSFFKLSNEHVSVEPSVAQSC